MPVYCDCERPIPDDAFCRRCGFRVKFDDSVPPLVALHPKVGAAIQELDAAICNGDAFDQPDARAEMLAHVERWMRLLCDDGADLAESLQALGARAIEYGNATRAGVEAIERGELTKEQAAYFAAVREGLDELVLAAIRFTARLAVAFGDGAPFEAQLVELIQSGMWKAS